MNIANYPKYHLTPPLIKISSEHQIRYTAYFIHLLRNLNNEIEKRSLTMRNQEITKCFRLIVCIKEIHRSRCSSLNQLLVGRVFWDEYKRVFLKLQQMKTVGSSTTISSLPTVLISSIFQYLIYQERSLIHSTSITFYKIGREQPFLMRPLVKQLAPRTILHNARLLWNYPNGSFDVDNEGRRVLIRPYHMIARALKYCNDEADPKISISLRNQLGIAGKQFERLLS